mgnify:CR=1 FL=1
MIVVVVLAGLVNAHQGMFVVDYQKAIHTS